VKEMWKKYDFHHQDSYEVGNRRDIFEIAQGVICPVPLTLSRVGVSLQGGNG